MTDLFRLKRRAEREKYWVNKRGHMNLLKANLDKFSIDFHKGWVVRRFNEDWMINE